MNGEKQQEARPLISVSLLLWHSKKYVKNCLESLFAQTYGNFELLVANNNEPGYEDNGLEEYREFVKKTSPQQKIEFFDNGGNIGFAAGHNKNTARAGGEYVFWLNHDVILAPDFLENALKVLKKNPQAYGVQARCLRLKPSEQGWKKTEMLDTTGLLMLKNRRIIGRGQGQPADGSYLREEEIFGVDGAVPVFCREALEDVKLCLNRHCEYMDEDFLAYKEDVDLAWRFKLFGWKAIYSPDVVAWHARGSGDSAQKNYIGIVKERLKINDFSKKLSFRNQRLMQIKNETWPLLLLHLPRFLAKEILAWGYFLIFEWRNREAVKGIVKLMPKMWKKRRIIQRKRKERGIGLREMKKWFA